MCSKNREDKRPINNSVQNLLDLEKTLALNEKNTFINFANNIKERKKNSEILSIKSKLKINQLLDLELLPRQQPNV